MSAGGGHARCGWWHASTALQLLTSCRASGPRRTQGWPHLRAVLHSRQLWQHQGSPVQSDQPGGDRDICAPDHLLRASSPAHAVARHKRLRMPNCACRRQAQAPVPPPSPCCHSRAPSAMAGDPSSRPVDVAACALTTQPLPYPFSHPPPNPSQQPPNITFSHSTSILFVTAACHLAVCAAVYPNKRSSEYPFALALSSYMPLPALAGRRPSWRQPASSLSTPLNKPGGKPDRLPGRCVTLLASAALQQGRVTADQ